MEATMIDKLVEGFRKIANELEELQLQLALGKAEAKDKFEYLKKRFNLFLHDAELKVNEAREFVEETKSKIDELRVQLALGKAETKDVFEAQRKKILAKIHDVETYIKSHPALAKVYDFVHAEFERIKLELEILAIDFKLAVTKSSDSIQKRRQEMEAIIKNLKEGLEKHKEAAEPSRQQHFRNEITLAYHHLKAAFN